MERQLMNEDPKEELIDTIEALWGMVIHLCRELQRLRRRYNAKSESTEVQET
jgi:hypothetical protein